MKRLIITTFVTIMSMIVYGQDWNTVGRIIYMLDYSYWSEAGQLLEQSKDRIDVNSDGHLAYNILKAGYLQQINEVDQASQLLNSAIEQCNQISVVDNEIQSTLIQKAYIWWNQVQSTPNMADNGTLKYFDSQNIRNGNYAEILYEYAVTSHGVSTEDIDQRLEELARIVPSDSVTTWAYMHLTKAAIAVNNNDPNGVAQYLKNARLCFEGRNNLEREGAYQQLLFNEIWFFSWNSLEKAKATFNEYISIAQRIAPIPITIRILNDFSSLFYSVGAIDLAIDCQKQALELAKDMNNDTQSDIVQRIDKWEQISSDTNLSATNLRIRAWNEMNQGDFMASISDLEKALTLLDPNLKSKGDSIALYTDCCKLLADNYLAVGDFKNAEATYLRGLIAIRSFDNINDYNYSTLLYGLGKFYMSVNNRDRALELFNETKYILESKPYLGEQYYACLGSIAAIYMSLGWHYQAWPFYNVVKNYFQSLPTSTNRDYQLARTLLNLSIQENALRWYDKCDEDIKQVLQLSENRAFNDILADAYFTRGQVNFARQTIPLEQIESDFMRSQELHNTYVITNELAGIEYLMGHDEKCLELSIEASKCLKDDILRQFSFLPSNERKTYWDAFAMTSQWTNAMLLAISTDNSQIPITLYDNALFTKGLLLRTNNFISREIENSGDSEAKQQYLRIQRLQTIAADEELPRDSVRIIQEQIRSIEKQLSSKFATIDRLKQSLSVSWGEVRSHLNDREIAVEFVQVPLLKRDRKSITNGRSRFYALLIDNKCVTPRIIPLCLDSELQELIDSRDPNLKEIRRTFKFYNSNENGATGKQLYELIWAPIDSVLQGGETIFYSPYGILNSIAFAAISDGNKCLADKYQLHQLSSTANLAERTDESYNIKTARIYGGVSYDASDSQLIAESARARQDVKLPQNELHIYMGDDYYAMTPSQLSRGSATTGSRSKWKRLENSLAESHNISSLMRERNVNAIMLDSVRANEESLKALSGHAPDIIHIATHGFFMQPDDEQIATMHANNIFKQQQTITNPMLRSGLVFAGGNRGWTGKELIDGIDDGIATADEISKLDLRGTSLVALSACQSGLGEVRSAEGVFGLQRAFKMAGVNTMIVSLWTVDDTATAIFMFEFYKNWLKDKNKSKINAFYKAQQTLKNDPNYSNPYYWAAFVMID